MIRPAVHNDINAIYDLCLIALSKSVYKDIKPSQIKIRKTIARAVSGPKVFCYVSEIDGKIVGILAGDYNEFIFSHSRIAGDLMFYVESGGEGKALLIEFKNWCRSRKVYSSEIRVSFGGPNMDRTGKLIESVGYKKVGGIYLELGHE